MSGILGRLHRIGPWSGCYKGFGGNVHSYRLLVKELQAFLVTDPLQASVAVYRVRSRVHRFGFPSCPHHPLSRSRPVSGRGYAVRGRVGAQFLSPLRRGDVERGLALTMNHQSERRRHRWE